MSDLLQNVIFGDLRATFSRAEPTGSGKWRVTQDVVARKSRADGAGEQDEVPMHDLVENGVFGAEGGGPGEPLYLGRHWIRSGAQQFTVIVPREPARAGIDPYHLLIDGESHDNVIPTRNEDGVGGEAGGGVVRLPGRP